MPARDPVRKPGMAGDLQMPASVGEYCTVDVCTVRARVRVEKDSTERDV